MVWEDYWCINMFSEFVSESKATRTLDLKNTENT